MLTELLVDTLELVLIELLVDTLELVLAELLVDTKRNCSGGRAYSLAFTQDILLRTMIILVICQTQLT